MLPGKYPLITSSHLLWVSGDAFRASELVSKYFAWKQKVAGLILG